MKIRMTIKIPILHRVDKHCKGMNTTRIPYKPEIIRNEEFSFFK